MIKLKDYEAAELTDLLLNLLHRVRSEDDEDMAEIVNS